MGAIQVISLCAGQGRDLLPVIAAHPRRPDICARLVELDPRNAQIAGATAGAAGLTNVEIATADASLTASYAGAVPAHLVLACGIFGNISDEDIAHTIKHLPTLCARAGAIVWTRGPSAPDLRPTIRGWFSDQGFEELFFQGEPESFGVGVHRLATEPKPFDSRVKLFTFIR
jgi:hypothetical protein